MLSPEKQLLTDFFEASRVYDTSVMARLSALPLNPKTDGIVDAFDVQRVDHNDGGASNVTVTARVRRFDGQVGNRQLVFVMIRRDGRLFIQQWREIP